MQNVDQLALARLPTLLLRFLCCRFSRLSLRISGIFRYFFPPRSRLFVNSITYWYLFVFILTLLTNWPKYLVGMNVTLMAEEPLLFFLLRFGHHDIICYIYFLWLYTYLLTHQWKATNTSIHTKYETKSNDNTHTPTYTHKKQFEIWVGNLVFPEVHHLLNIA